MVPLDEKKNRFSEVEVLGMSGATVVWPKLAYCILDSGALNTFLLEDCISLFFVISTN